MALSKEYLKKAACDAISDISSELNDVSNKLWNHPELAFQEHYASTVLTEFLEESGFSVDRQYVLETGFRGQYGDTGHPNVCVVCEYDALPDIGHACGHNLIAEVGIGAGVGIKAAIDAANKAGRKLGKVTVLGTPAEEDGCGKELIIRHGALTESGVDCAMMAHPAPMTVADPDKYIKTADVVDVKYTGKASHAAGFPWEGVNALDAAVMAYVGISTMRQQFQPGWMAHGVITNGGKQPNIIPEEASLRYYIRASSDKEVEPLKAKLLACFDGAATATGCKVTYEWSPAHYSAMVTNQTLCRLYEDNAKSLGVEFGDIDSVKVSGGSTDMGNISRVVPSLHPLYYIGGLVMNHTRDFTKVAGSPEAQPYTLAQAKALAMTAIDVLWEPDLVKQMKEELKIQMSDD